jgi:hypothetical protein
MDRTPRSYRIGRARSAFSKSSLKNTIPFMSTSQGRLSAVITTTITPVATSTLNFLGMLSEDSPLKSQLRTMIPPKRPHRDPNRNPNVMQNSDRPTTHSQTTINGYFHREIRLRTPLWNWWDVIASVLHRPSFVLYSRFSGLHDQCGGLPSRCGCLHSRALQFARSVSFCPVGVLGPAFCTVGVLVHQEKYKRATRSVAWGRVGPRAGIACATRGVASREKRGIDVGKGGTAWEAWRFVRSVHPPWGKYTSREERGEM